MSLEDALKNAGQELAREYEGYDAAQRRTRLELIRAEDAELRAEDAERAFHPTSRRSPAARAAAALEIAGAERDVAAGAVAVMEIADAERGAAEAGAVAVTQAPVLADGGGSHWVEDWTIAAACRPMDPDELFVRGASQNRAKAICAACPVRTECLADALDNRVEFGVWGGMTERERRALLRRRPDVNSWRKVLEAKREQYEAYRRQHSPAAGANQAPA